jgi:hypothetical protein
MRTMTTNGIMMITFTPLLGMTDIIRDFLKIGVSEQWANTSLPRPGTMFPTMTAKTLWHSGWSSIRAYEMQHYLATAPCIELRNPLKNERTPPPEYNRTDILLRPLHLACAFVTRYSMKYDKGLR